MTELELFQTIHEHHNDQFIILCDYEKSVVEIYPYKTHDEEGIVMQRYHEPICDITFETLSAEKDVQQSVQYILSLFGLEHKALGDIVRPEDGNPLRIIRHQTLQQANRQKEFAPEWISHSVTTNATKT